MSKIALNSTLILISGQIGRLVVLQVGGSVCSKSLGQLVIYLCYADRYVRRCAAARLYEALTLYGDEASVPQENLEQVRWLNV